VRTAGPTLREVSSPLVDEDLAPLVPEHTTVQISTRLTDDEFRRLAAFMEAYPEVRLRVYGGYDGSISDLEFLRFFPALRRFSVDAMYELPSLDGIRHLSDELEDLVIGRTRSKRFSLRNLARFRRLRRLLIEGQQKDADALADLESLEDLTLRSITLPDLSPLLPLTRLQFLALKLGGTRNLELLPRIGSLRYVELWRITGMREVSALAEVLTLEGFFLQSMRGVTRLPSFAGARALRSAVLYTMRGITDLAPLAAAPALEYVKLIEMCQLEPEDLRPFVGHATLQHGTWGLCSERKNSAAYRLLPFGYPPSSVRAGTV
jgi:hypothetical protein